jgi:hypothetical protein
MQSLLLTCPIQLFYCNYSKFNKLYHRCNQIKINTECAYKRFLNIVPATNVPCRDRLPSKEKRMLRALLQFFHCNNLMEHSLYNVVIWVIIRNGTKLWRKRANYQLFSTGKKFPSMLLWKKCSQRCESYILKWFILLFSGRLNVHACLSTTLSIPLNYAYKSPSTCQFLHARSGYAKLILHPWPWGAKIQFLLAGGEWRNLNIRIGYL